MFSHRQSLAALLLGLLMMVFASSVPAAQVNINTADAATLAKELDGVGLKRAQAIVEYRQKHGPFKSVDELALVKGIGPAAVAKNRDRILIDAKGGAATPAKSSGVNARDPVGAVRQSGK